VDSRAGVAEVLFLLRAAAVAATNWKAGKRERIEF
jgi:hypothetical protein